MKRYGFILLLFCICFSVNSQSLKELSELYFKGNLNEALTMSTELLQNDANNGSFNLMHGRVLADMRKWTEAVPYLNRAIEIDRGNTEVSGWGYGYLGQCYFMLGRYEESEKSLKKAVKLKATENSVSYAQKRIFSFGFDKYFSKWQIIETENIRFHIQNPKNFTNLESFVAKRQRAFEDISAKLGSKLPKKIDFFVWENPEEPYEKFKIKLGFASPEIVSLYSHRNQTPGHEMTHIISHYMSVNSVKTPLINEGLAVYLDMTYISRIWVIRDVMKRHCIEHLEVQGFWTKWEDFPHEVSYPFAGAFMEAMIKKYGLENLKPLLVNQTYENARLLFGEDFDLLIKSFESMINE